MLVPRLDKIYPQRNLLVIKYKNHSILVDYSFINHLQDLFGKVYEIYGTIEAFKQPKDLHSVDSVHSVDSAHSVYCSALLLNIVEDADMSILEQSILIFNKKIYPEYNDIFI